jgi:hypothetical protein
MEGTTGDTATTGVGATTTTGGGASEHVLCKNSIAQAVLRQAASGCLKAVDCVYPSDFDSRSS